MKKKINNGIMLIAVLFVICAVFGCTGKYVNLEQSDLSRIVVGVVENAPMVVVKPVVIEESREELLEYAPENLRIYVTEIKREGYRVVWKYNYKIKKGDTIKKLKKMGVTDKELKPHLKTVTEKNLNQFQDGTKIGYKYLLAGDEIQGNGSFTFYQSNEA